MTPRRQKPKPQARPLIRPLRLRRLLRKMIETYSPFGKEGDVVDLLYNHLRRAGLPVERQRVDEDRDNLLVLPPNGLEPSLLFLGHIDTVEAYDLEQIEVTERGDEIIGLGSADMKSGCAAMIEALMALHDSGRDSLPIAMALVVGEEESGDGTARLLEEAGPFNLAIVGEPTDLTPCLSHYGYMEVQLLTRGRRMHASMAPLGSNAIQNMLELLLSITAFFSTRRPDVVFNIRELESLKAGFAVPDRCEAWLDLHVPPLAPMGEITVDLEELVASHKADHPGLDTVIQFITIDAGYSIPQRGPVFEMLRAVYSMRDLPFDPQVFPSHSDANQLFVAGIRPVVLGPGKLEKAHTPEESVPFSQVIAAAELYLDISLQFDYHHDL